MIDEQITLIILYIYFFDVKCGYSWIIGYRWLFILFYFVYPRLQNHLS